MNHNEAREAAVQAASKKLGLPVHQLLEDFYKDVLAGVKKTLEREPSQSVLKIQVPDGMNPLIRRERWFLNLARPHLLETLENMAEWTGSDRMLVLIFAPLGSMREMVEEIRFN